MSINELKNEKAVYIIIDKNRSDEENIVYKIGFSNKVRDRVKTISKTFEFLGSKADIEIFSVIYCNNPRKLEATLHKCLLCYKMLDKHEFFKSSLDKLNQRLMLLGDLSRYN
jgi:hypothetical protein